MLRKAQGIRGPALSTLPKSGPGIRMQHLPGGRSIITGEPRAKRGSSAVRACPFRVRLDKPEYYPGTDLPTNGWVEWGVVNTVIPSNIASPFTLSEGVKVWVAAVTNGEFPLKVLSATLAGGATVPDDIGGTATNPPTTAHFLLGQILGEGTEESPFRAVSAGCGNLALSAVAAGYSCELAVAGDPEADPPVPASPGGVKTDYQLRWDRVN